MRPPHVGSNSRSPLPGQLSAFVNQSRSIVHPWLPCILNLSLFVRLEAHENILNGNRTEDGAPPPRPSEVTLKITA